MSDANTPGRVSLAAALRALPQAAPAHDAWSSLARELAPARVTRRRRYQMPLALAASLLVAFLVAQAWRTTAPSPDTIVATAPSGAASSKMEDANTDDSMKTAMAAADAQLTALQSRSHDLEGWLHDTAEVAAPLPGQDLAAASEIESLIGLVDVELAAPEQHHPVKLWRRRVDLLEELTALRYSNYRLAEASATTTGNWIN
jgi:hypothetical protein